jgi:hypothetical protein
MDTRIKTKSWGPNASIKNLCNFFIYRAINSLPLEKIEIE